VAACRLQLADISEHGEFGALLQARRIPNDGESFTEKVGREQADPLRDRLRERLKELRARVIATASIFSITAKAVVTSFSDLNAGSFSTIARERPRIVICVFKNGPTARHRIIGWIDSELMAAA
jgi:hypothetical protein